MVDAGYMYPFLGAIGTFEVYVPWRMQRACRSDVSGPLALLQGLGG